MQNVKAILCEEIITKGNKGRILDIVNKLLENPDNKDINVLIDIYLNYEKYDKDTLLLKFRLGIENFYKTTLNAKNCLTYLLKNEIIKILDKTSNYYESFHRMLEIIKLYNRYDNLSNQEKEHFIYGDIFAETISKSLSEILSDFDITEDVVFSSLTVEEDAIKEINTLYSKSNIDDSLKEILKEFNF